MIRWRLALRTTLVATVISLQACHANQKLGAATPDRLMEQYLLALAAKDEKLIRQLVPENYIATQEIQAKISQFGGHKIQQPQFTYIKTKPTLWEAKVNGFYLDRNGIRRKFEDTISIIYQGKESWKLYQGRWYLLLGKDKMISYRFESRLFPISKAISSKLFIVGESSLVRHTIEIVAS